MALGTGRDQGFLIEHFGLFDLRFRLIPLPDGLPGRSSVGGACGFRCRAGACRASNAWRAPTATAITFDIDVTFPLIGWLMHYRGWLLPQDAKPPRSA